MTDPFSYRCTTCGETHEGIPDLAFDAPHQYASLSEEQRRTIGELTSDTCVIAGEDFFVRGCLEIPIHGRSDPFAWGVWVSLSAKSYARYLELFDDRERVAGPPFFGWLCNNVPEYPATANLKTDVHVRPYPQRPAIVLQPTHHPLAIDQRDGISIERLCEIITSVRHGNGA